MGPNTNDRLDLKTQQMQNTHLALLERDQSGRPEDWNYTRVEKKLILKGRLFYPLMSTRKQHGTQTPKPLIASNTHLQAWWLRGTEADNLMDGEYWCLLNRSEWFAPLILPAETERVISRDEIINAIQNHFQSASHPIIAIKLAIITDSKNVNHPTFHEETERILLVHNQWPNAHDKPRPIT
jgi:hypothetical protein